ncbi:restriction endonuclease subunit S [Vibrio sp. 10N.247.311.47]|uniref:restriction endonuclease subunit S n=1 Tax=Vibrio sp. 10N.247.311.47 TaxID=3229988 RepID=UPI0035537370
MTSNWATIRLDECASFQEGYVNPTQKKEHYFDGPVKWLRAVDLNNGSIRDTSRTLSEEGFKSAGKSALLFEPGTLAISKSGTIGRIGILEDYMCGNRAVINIKVNQDVCDNLYIFYVLLTSRKVIETLAVGSVQKNLYTSALGSLELKLPPLPIQQAIAIQLSTLDKKIDLNAQTNQTLEEMAQAIFKSWFVDFDPVKAKMNSELPEGMDAATASLFPEKLVSETGLPEGWIQSEIGDEVTVVGGGTPSKKNDDFWVDGDIHWTSPKDLSGVQDKVLLDTASKVTEAGLKKISSGLLPIDTVLLSSRAPVGYLALAKVPMAINQGYIAMKCEKQLPPEFVLQWCVHRMDEIKQRASGSTFAEISKKSFKPISVVVPSGEVLSAYRKVVKPLYDAITSNARQNEQLSTLRDTLLPKLLSGEVNLEEDRSLSGALI